MLLTLTATCLKSLLRPGRSARPKLDLLDLPEFTRHTLGLHGLNVSTDMLAGVSQDRLEALRDRADRSGCSCLLLVESDSQPLGNPSDSVADAVLDRMGRVIRAASLLGCNSVAIRSQGRDDPAVFEETADRIKAIMELAERAEVNLLLAPNDGLTSKPERVTELIKKVGGFRVGTFPDFQAAAGGGDPVNYLRRLTPYASIVSATTIEFSGPKSAPADGVPEPVLKHATYDLAPLVSAILSVGYDGTLAVDYRGTGDVTLGVTRSRTALEAAIAAEADE